MVSEPRACMTRESKSQHGVIVVNPSVALEPLLAQEPIPGLGDLLNLKL
jgi:hypothetical protein